MVRFSKLFFSLHLTVASRVAYDFLLLPSIHQHPPPHNLEIRNPYLSLLPLTPSSPALLNAMLAVAYRHYLNLTGPSPTIPALHPSATSLVAVPASSTSTLYSTPALLRYKIASYHHLSSTLSHPTSVPPETILAAVMLFLFFETLEGGDGEAWKVHIKGARRVVGWVLRSLIGGAQNNMIRIFMSHVEMIEIMGNTLTPGGLGQGVVRESGLWYATSEELLQLLHERDTHNFLGCPAPLLLCLHAINNLKVEPAPDWASFGATLTEIWSFDAGVYVATRPTGLVHPHQERLVEAWKVGVEIYLHEACGANEVGMVELYQRLMTELAGIPRGSPLWKGAVWLVFVAGVGTRGQEERGVVRGMLGWLWEVLPQGNIVQMGRVLEEMWDTGSSKWGWWGGGGVGGWLFI